MSLQSDWILDAVEYWAAGYSMLRETGAFCRDASRMDAILVPVSREAHCMLDSKLPFFERPRFVGIEVKISRSDYLAGVRKGQLEKYQGFVSGLYLASYRDVCRTSELPDGVGHIICLKKPKGRFMSCVCKRHPKYSDVDTPPDVPWRCLFRLAEQYQRQVAEHEQEFKRAIKAIGQEAAGSIFANIEKMTEALDIDSEKKELVGIAVKELSRGMWK